MTRYFKGLDTLRAVAALVVVWGHIELLKKQEKIPNLIDADFMLFPDGHISVILFFVLSGFLITYLLVKEKEKNGTISFRNFYMRRVLRIWPLYYAILLLSFLLIQSDYGMKTIVLCLSIFPNVAHALGEGWPSSPQIWSIGVEEQFYLFWPLVLYFLPEKRVAWVLTLFFVAYAAFPHVFRFINAKTIQNEEWAGVVDLFFWGTKFNCMALGALMGYALAKEHKWTLLFRNDALVLLLMLLGFGLWFFRFNILYFTDEFYAILFSFMILGIVSSRRIQMDTSISRFLGKISYGIYMYHWIVIVLALKFIKFQTNPVFFNVSLYVTVFGLTILISWISYQTLERFFLGLKKRFETK